jgi:hypothetical protein
MARHQYVLNSGMSRLPKAITTLSDFFIYGKTKKEVVA